MAEDNKAKRRIRTTETDREKAAKTATPHKPRRLKQATSTASDGLKSAGRIGRKEYHPIRLPDNKVGRVLTKSRRATPNFFREAWAELKQVTWPNRRETAQLTIAVLIFAIVFGSIIAITDYGLEKIFRQLLDL